MPTLRRRVRRRLGRRLGPRLARRLSIVGADAGLVSVVLVCEEIDLPRLDAAVASVLGQRHAFLELLLCPVVGAGAEVRAAATSYDDSRVTVLPESPSWGSAADRGAADARGVHLMFLRGCDVLADDAVAVLATARAQSGSALAVGRVEQGGLAELWMMRAQLRAHAAPGCALDPADRPELAGRLTPAGVMLDRVVWRDSGSRLDGEDDWLLSPSVALFLAEAEQVDVIDAAAYTWLPDHGTRAFGATPSLLPDLVGWHHRIELVAAAVEGTPLAAGWARHVAGTELPRLLQEVERATDEQWAELQALAAAYDEEPGLVDGIDVVARALVRLAAQGRRDDLRLLDAELAGLGTDLPTRVEGADVLVEWRSVGLPAADRRLGADETRLRAHVARVSRGPEQWTAELFIEVAHVDLASSSTVVTVRDAAGRELSTEPLPAAEATRWAGRRFQSAVGVAVVMPVGTASVELSVATHDLERSGVVSIPGPHPTVAEAPVTVHDVALEAGALVLSADGSLESLRLLDRSDEEIGVGVTVSAAGEQVVVELVSDRFGRTLPLASGPHRVVAAAGTGHTNVTVTPALRDRLPLELVGERHRVRVHLGPRGGLVLGIGAPLGDDELGPRAQERLRAAYVLDDRPVDPDLCYVETYAGRSATDSPLAIVEELLRRRADGRIRWGIADHGQWVPEGVEPVLLRSREWYDVLAQAGCLVLNTDVEPWFRRRSGQFLLQTFHGYPSKAMGATQWRALDLTPSRIAEFRARGVDTWSAILTPDPSMTRHYRDEYGYTGPAFEQGYPRNDALVGAAAGTRRDETRALLGIAEGQRAILYAPTWREHLAVRARGAEMTDFLDPVAVAEALGEEYVLLLRGHRFHAPVARHPRVVDVTGHPEINDLVLASDAAVLDYSSLRFDYAITGKPMVFLVPDLAEYDAGSRSFLFPFEESAPGPFVDDSAAVVRELRDLEDLRGRYADEIASFNATYNRWHDGHAASRVVDQLLALL